MTDFARGWTTFCNEKTALVLADMSAAEHDIAVRYLCDLAVRGGKAIDAGQAPPGLPLDGTGLAYSVVVEGVPLIVEYLVVHDIREFRVTDAVWLG